jgi:LacI family transcriptional regulator
MIPDAELIHLMKQMPGMVIINRIIPGFEKRCGPRRPLRRLACDPSSDSTGPYRIGYLCSNHPISDAEDRLQGYYDALRENGCRVMTVWWPTVNRMRAAVNRP